MRKCDSNVTLHTSLTNRDYLYFTRLSEDLLYMKKEREGSYEQEEKNITKKF